METRLKEMEKIVVVLESEHKMIASSLNNISTTLLEMKEQGKMMIELRISQNSQDHLIETIENKIDVLFKKSDHSELAIHQLETNGIGTNIKIGGAEKFTWMMISALIGLGVIFFKGSS